MSEIQSEESNQPLRWSELTPFKFSCKMFIKYVGPGFLVCIAYIDPGNLAGDLQASIQSGNKLLWLLIIAQIFGFLFQMLASNLGTVTGNNLAELCRKGYKRKVSIGLWIMTEIAIIGSDIQEVIGSAIALNILFGLPIYLGIILTVLDSMLVLLIQVYNMNIIEYLFLVFVGVMSICFAINMLHIHKDTALIVDGLLVPSLPPKALGAAVGLVGAIIMPHNLYLHSSLADTRQINRLNPNQVRDTCYYYAYDAALSLLISCFINVCIIITFANIVQLSGNDQYNNLSISNAGLALNQVFGGNSGQYIWGIGLFAAGQSSTITGTMAGQFVMQGFLNMKVSRAKRSLISRSIAIFPALFVSFFSNLEIINQKLNILQAIQLPFAVIPLLAFTSNKQLMGQFVINKWMQRILILISILMVSLNIYGMVPTNFNGRQYIDWLFVGGSVLYLMIITLLIIQYPQIDPLQIDIHETEREFSYSVVIDNSNSLLQSSLHNSNNRLTLQPPHLLKAISSQHYYSNNNNNNNHYNYNNNNIKTTDENNIKPDKFQM